MSSPKRRQSTSLIDQLTAQPHRFEFFQAVRLLECWLTESPDNAENAKFPSISQRRKNASQLPPKLHFRNSLAMSFPPSEIEALKISRREGAATASLQKDDVTRVDLTPTFMGLLGVSGTLPLVYTEQISSSETLDKDYAARSFLDLFTDRWVALFYAAWKKNRLHIAYESSQKNNRKNQFSQMLQSFAGIGHGGLHSRLQGEHGGVHDETLMFFAGAIQQRTLSGEQLGKLLSRYFGVGVKIEQFVGRWYELPKNAQWSLGKNNGMLGKSALASHRIWQRDLCAKVIVGPLDHERFRRFLPGAPGALALHELITTLSGVSIDYEINLSLSASAIQGSTLNSKRSPYLNRLGWDTYIQTTPSVVDRSDVHYHVIQATDLH
jgi:type VI secretion system protein ImpH